MDYYQILSDTVAGNRQIDDNSLVAMAVLNDRLERLKNVSSLFDNVEMSPFVQKVVAEESVILN